MKIIVVAAVLLCAAQASAVTPLADVPLIGDGHRPRVAVDINGHRGVACIIDTGATVGVIGRDLAIGTERVGESHVTTANGDYGMPLLRVRDVTIGAAHARDVEFVQRDASWFGHGGNAPCIIGMSFVAQFAVDLDGHARRLRLFPSGTDPVALLDPSQRNGAALDASFDADAISTTVVVNDIKAAARIDTGWGFVTPNRALLDRLGFARNDARFFQKDMQEADSGRLVSVRMTTLDRVQLGHVRALNVVADGDPDRDAAAIVRRHAEPYLQIGWPLLSDHRFVFDARTHRAAFVP